LIPEKGKLQFTDVHRRFPATGARLQFARHLPRNHRQLFYCPGTLCPRPPSKPRASTRTAFLVPQNAVGHDQKGQPTALGGGCEGIRALRASSRTGPRHRRQLCSARPDYEGRVSK
jgi:hypothetical protein